MRKKFNNALYQPAHAAIDAKEKEPEKRDRHDHHPSGHEHFAARRPGDLAHLHAHFVQKTAQALGIFAESLEGRGDGVSAAAIAAATIPAVLQLDRRTIQRLIARYKLQGPADPDGDAEGDAESTP